MMTKINSPEQIPQMLSDLKKERFYGQVNLIFRNGHIARVVTEISQVFDNQRDGTYDGKRY